MTAACAQRRGAAASPPGQSRRSDSIDSAGPLSACTHTALENIGRISTPNAKECVRRTKYSMHEYCLRSKLSAPDVAASTECLANTSHTSMHDRNSSVGICNAHITVMKTEKTAQCHANFVHGPHGIICSGPKFWTHGSVCCACAQRPGLPRQSFSRTLTS